MNGGLKASFRFMNRKRRVAQVSSRDSCARRVLPPNATILRTFFGLFLWAHGRSCRSVGRRLAHGEEEEMRPSSCDLWIWEPAIAIIEHPLLVTWFSGEALQIP